MPRSAPTSPSTSTTVADRNRLADEIQRTVAFGVGRNNVEDDAPVDHPLFASAAWDAAQPLHRGEPAAEGAHPARHRRLGQPLRRCLRGRDAGASGSASISARAGFGHTIASGFLALAQGEPWGDARARARSAARSRYAARRRLLAADEPCRASMPTPAASGSRARSSASSAARRWSWSTTITTSPGRRRTTAKNSWSCARARRRPSLDSGIRRRLDGRRSPSSSKVRSTTPRRSAPRCTPRSTARGG